MTSTTGKCRGLFLSALLVLSVIVGTVAFTGSAAALEGLTAGSTADVAIGQQSVTQATTFDADLTDGENVTITIDTSELRAAGGAVSSVNTVSSSNGNVSVPSSGVDSTGNITVTLNDTSASGFNPDPTTVTVSATLDTDGVLQTSTGITYTVIDGNSGAASVTQSFDLTPLTISGTTYEADGATPLGSVTVEMVETGTSTTSSGSGTYTLNISDLTQISDETSVDVKASKSGNESVTNAADISTGHVTGFDFTLPATTASGLDSLYWRGQEDTLTGLQNNEEYTLERVDDYSSDGFVSSTTLIRERSTDASGNLSLDTSGLDADHYVILGPGLPAADGSSPNPPLFEVAVQDFNTSFADDAVSAGDDTTLAVDSNRGAFNVTVEAQGLEEDDLMDIFRASNPAHGDDVNDDVVEFEVQGGTETVANFTGISPGDYTFDFEVTDTDVTASADLTVSERDVTQDFSQSVYEEEAGDLASITVELEDTDEAYLFVGGTESGWIGGVKVTDTDDDGEVTVLFNSYLAGQSGDLSDVFVGATSDDAIDTRFDNSTLVANHGLSADTDVNTNLTEPIEAGDYDLRAAASADMNVDGSLVDENDVATLILGERSTDGVTLHTAPAGASDADDLDELQDLLTERDTIAFGDRLVIEVEASGIYGYLANESPSGLAALDDGIPQPVSLSLAQTNEGPNRDPAELDLTDSDGMLFVDSAENRFYVVLELKPTVASTTERELAAGQEWAVTFTAGDSGDPDYANYVTGTSEESVSGTFSLASADASFDNVNVDSQVQVMQYSAAEVSGTTNVAPGTDLNVRLRASGESPFLKTGTAVVESDGSWSVEFDMSEQSIGQEFDASVRLGSTTLIPDMDGVVVEQVATPTPTATPTATPSPTPTPTTAPPTEPPSPTPTTADQPGFGIAVAILALLVAGLLAARRRD